MAARAFFYLIIAFAIASPAVALAEGNSRYGSKESFASYAKRLRENAIRKVEPSVSVPTSRPESAGDSGRWRKDIVTTTFWVGEKPTENNPTPNNKSSWDQEWEKNFGGYDDPEPKNRRGYLPKSFIPKLNPFYIALPYNDTTRGRTKPEAPKVIPWFHDEFERKGKSVCHNRWVAIRYGNRICYAQWKDVGPFRTDHWQYVFGNERPSPNINKGAGLDVSPAVRDYLGMKWSDVTDWKFVEVEEVGPGPWRLYGSDNPFVQKRKRLAQNEE